MGHAVFCFVLFCFVLFCFVLFCFVLFCFVLFCFVLFCFVFHVLFAQKLDICVRFLHFDFSLFYLALCFQYHIIFVFCTFTVIPAGILQPPFYYEGDVPR